MAHPSGAPSSTEAAVLAADDARYRAMLAGDTQALDGLLSEDLVYTHSNGASDDKPQYMAAIGARVFDYRRCERETAHFQDYGHVALLHGTVRLEAMVAGQLKQLHNQYLTVWVREGDAGVWRLRAWASTLIPPAAP